MLLACPVIDQEMSNYARLIFYQKIQTLRTDKVISYFDILPIHDKNMVNYSTVHGVQFLEPMFSFLELALVVDKHLILSLLTFADHL